MPSHGNDRRPTRPGSATFGEVRDAVFASLEVAHAAEPELTKPEWRVLHVMHLLFLGWSKFEDRIAVPRIAVLAGWWDGESIPPGETRPKPSRSVRRRITSALRRIDETGAVRYRPATGRPGTEGQNLSTIVLPRPEKEGRATGPLSDGKKGATTVSKEGQWNGPKEGLPTGPHLGNLGNHGGRGAHVARADVDRLAALLTDRTTGDNADGQAQKIAELLLEYATLAELELGIRALADAAGGVTRAGIFLLPEPLEYLIDDDNARAALTADPRRDFLAAGGLRLTIATAARGDWRTHMPAAAFVASHLEDLYGSDFLAAVALRLRVEGISGPRVALRVAHDVAKDEGLDWTSIDLSECP